MSNQMIVSTREISWSEIPSEIKLLRCQTQQTPNDDVFCEKLKLSSQLPPDGTSPPKNQHIYQYLERVLSQSHLKLNTFSYRQHKIKK
jgi:hypothetical protein